MPTSPTGTNPLPSGTPLPGLTRLPIVTPPTNFPPLSGPARTFIFERADYRVAEYTEKSRFVLYDNGALALRYPNRAVSITVHIRGRMPFWTLGLKAALDGVRSAGSKVIR